MVIVQSSHILRSLAGLQCDVDRVYSSLMLSVSSSSSYLLWLPELHLWFDYIYSMLSLCRLDSLFFLIIFFSGFIVSNESVPPMITFVAPHCSSRNFISLSGTLFALSYTNSSWLNLHICIYIFTNVATEIAAEILWCNQLKSLVVKQAMLQFYYNFTYLFVKTIAIFHTLKSIKNTKIIFHLFMKIIHIYT